MPSRSPPEIEFQPEGFRLADCASRQLDFYHLPAGLYPSLGVLKPGRLCPPVGPLAVHRPQSDLVLPGGDTGADHPDVSQPADGK